MGINLKEKAMKRIIKKLLKIDGNLLLSENIFSAKKVVDWILSTTKDPKVIDKFMLDLERHLEGSSRVSWVEEVFSKKKVI
jgi:hypothetical protein